MDLDDEREGKVQRGLRRRVDSDVIEVDTGELEVRVGGVEYEYQNSEETRDGGGCA